MDFRNGNITLSIALNIGCDVTGIPSCIYMHEWTASKVFLVDILLLIKQ